MQCCRYMLRSNMQCTDVNCWFILVHRSNVTRRLHVPYNKVITIPDIQFCNLFLHNLTVKRVWMLSVRLNRALRICYENKAINCKKSFCYNNLIVIMTYFARKLSPSGSAKCKNTLQGNFGYSHYTFWINRRWPILVTIIRKRKKSQIFKINFDMIDGPFSNIYIR